MCPRSSDPILFSKLLYKMGHTFLDVQYMMVKFIVYCHSKSGHEWRYREQGGEKKNRKRKEERDLV